MLGNRWRGGLRSFKWIRTSVALDNKKKKIFIDHSQYCLIIKGIALKCPKVVTWFNTFYIKISWILKVKCCLPFGLASFRLPLWFHENTYSVMH